MKVFIYIISAIQFYLYRFFSKRVPRYHVFIMTHDTSVYGNIAEIKNTILKNNPDVAFYVLKKEGIKESFQDKLRTYIELVLVAPKQLARAEYIYLDNVYLPMAFMRFHKDVKIVQLWHGLNTIKKFGQMSNTGLLKKLEKMANSTYTHVLVGSSEVVDLHAQAFGVEKRKVYPVGLPRIDLLQNKKISTQIKQDMLSKYEKLRDKKIILYAPTFRDNQLKALDDEMNLKDISNMLDEDSIIIAKWHPHLKVSEESAQLEEQIAQEYSIFELMCVADLLITDYSSIVFEFVLMEKPILIYAYDMDKYDRDIRGFYKPYHEVVGTSICRTKAEIIQSINKLDWACVHYSHFLSHYSETVIENGCMNSYELLYTIQDGA